MATKQAPAGLNRAGKALWTAITEKYEFRPDELAILEDACRMADLIAAMEGAWADDGSPMTSEGSQGQLVVHPLIAELRQYRNARARLLKQLALPDDVGAASGNGNTNARSAQARDAANARWARRGA
ncbi:MAG TPA: hypothetical protein VHB02_06085 [Acidimicrobiales bacterium]|nr:hypothetical protein [Acidimicrobiales bacterium]